MSYSFKEFEQKLQKISDITLIEFTGIKKPIKWQCNICKQIYYREKADGILNRTSLCHKCQHISLKEQEKRIKQKQDEVLSRGYSISILSYNGETEPLIYKCNKCGKEHHLKVARHLLDKNKKVYCTCCYMQPSLQSRIDSIIDDCVHNSFEFLFLESDRRNAHFLCKSCGSQFRRDIYRFTQNTDCPICNHRQVPYEVFLQRLKEIQGDDFEILDGEKYQSLKSNRLLVKHKCGFIYSTLPKNLLRHNCPRCSRKMSHGEKTIMQF